MEIADLMLENFGKEGTIVADFFSTTHQVLNEITRKFPRAAWDTIAKYLGPPIDSRAFHVREWLRGGEHYAAPGGVITMIPADVVWKWVDENVQQRARYLAGFVPKDLFRSQGNVCYARELLVRYGNREDVRRSFRANFSTEGWSGSEAEHYRKKKHQLADFRNEETNNNVKKWIDEYIAILDKQIEQSVMDEERDDH